LSLSAAGSLNTTSTLICSPRRTRTAPKSAGRTQNSNGKVRWPQQAILCKLE
jgi:hypothetical protein